MHASFNSISSGIELKAYCWPIYKILIVILAAEIGKAINSHDKLSCVKIKSVSNK